MDEFLQEHELIQICDGSGMCSLRGGKWIFCFEFTYRQFLEVLF